MILIKGTKFYLLCKNWVGEKNGIDMWQPGYINPVVEKKKQAAIKKGYIFSFFPIDFIPNQ